MNRHWLLAWPAIIFVTSCTPTDVPVQTAATAPKRVAQPAALLKGLALDVPTDVAKLATAGAAAPAVVTSAAPAFVTAGQSLDDSQRALTCLSEAIYYEARSEPLDGQRAVAQVVLNRVRDRAFPGSVCGVVYQGSNRRTGCQFTFTCDGSMLRPRNPSSWARSTAVAAAALGGYVYAPVGSATHYHTSAILPWWAPSLTRLTTIGAHIFYRWPSLMEKALAFRQTYSGSEPVVSAGADYASTVPSDAFGVTVHGGSTEAVAGLTIHRGGGSAAAIMPVATPAPVLVAAPPATRPAVASMGGVRVHRGGVMPTAMPGDGAGATVAADPI